MGKTRSIPLPQRTSSAAWLGHSRDAPSFQNHTQDAVAVSCNAG